MMKNHVIATILKGIRRESCYVIWIKLSASQVGSHNVIHYHTFSFKNMMTVMYNMVGENLVGKVKCKR